MRTQHTLWRCKNGWILVPEGDNGVVRAEAADEITVFRTLKEFADEYPKRERKRRTRKTKIVREDPLEEHPMNPINQQ